MYICIVVSRLSSCKLCYIVGQIVCSHLYPILPPPVFPASVVGPLPLKKHRIPT